MKRLCALFALLLLLLLPYNACAKLQIIPADGSDAADNPSELSEDYKARLARWIEEKALAGNALETDDVAEAVEESDAPEEEKVDEKEEKDDTEDAKGSGEGEQGIIKSMQTAVENAGYGIINGVIDQLFEGSITLFEVETTQTEDGPDGEEIITYKIVNKVIDPFGPLFVKKSVLYTGALYLIIALLVLPGSFLMLLIYNNAEYPFVETMEYITGEERPYDNEMQKFVCKVTITLWAIYIGATLLITGIRNLTVYAITPSEIVMPALYSDSIPARLLEGLANFNNAFQSTFGVYGIHAFAAVLLVIGTVSIILLTLGHIRGFVTINTIAWGFFILCNFIDIINTGSLSAGVSLYLYYGNPAYVTVGMIAGGLLNVFIAYKLVKWTTNDGINQAMGLD